MPVGKGLHPGDIFRRPLFQKQEGYGRAIVLKCQLYIGSEWYWHARSPWFDFVPRSCEVIATRNGSLRPLTFRPNVTEDSF